MTEYKYIVLNCPCEHMEYDEDMLEIYAKLPINTDLGDISSDINGVLPNGWYLLPNAKITSDNTFDPDQEFVELEIE